MVMRCGCYDFLVTFLASFFKMKYICVCIELSFAARVKRQRALLFEE